MSESVMSPAAAAPQPVQPTLALPQLVGIQGLYPQRGTEAPPQTCQGMVLTFAGLGGAFGAPPAQGQLYPMSLTSLFSLYGTAYGGDGKSSFGLPNLKGLIPVGGTPGEAEAQTLALTYVIAAGAGGVPVGTIVTFGGNFAPPGWVRCDGAAYSPDDYPQLYQAIGNTFGGDGGTFCVPDLTGRAAVGAGTGWGLPPVALGQAVAGAISGLGLTAMIAAAGLFPDPGGPGAFPENEPFLGQVALSGAPYVPQGWLPADGRVIPVRSNPALFAAIGTTYGGDGVTSFGLPDLRGRMMVGT